MIYSVFPNCSFQERMLLIFIIFNFLNLGLSIVIDDFLLSLILKSTVSSMDKTFFYITSIHVALSSIHPWCIDHLQCKKETSKKETNLYVVFFFARKTSVEFTHIILYDDDDRNCLILLAYNTRFLLIRILYIIESWRTVIDRLIVHFLMVKQVLYSIIDSAGWSLSMTKNYHF